MGSRVLNAADFGLHSVRNVLRIRFAKYTLVGLIPFGLNLASMFLLTQFGVSAEDATRSAFLIGGQASFWSHDRLTFGDHHVSIKGWPRRWVLFMPGQAIGFTANFVATFALAEAGCWTLVIYSGGLVSGIMATYTWNKYVSHRPIS